jgi:hypothetical protein
MPSQDPTPQDVRSVSLSSSKLGRRQPLKRQCVPRMPGKAKVMQHTLQHRPFTSNMQGIRPSFLPYRPYYPVELDGFPSRLPI